MSTPRNIVRNIRSAVVVDGQPKLPTSSQLSEGEIAVNYAKGYETLSFKNNSNEIVSLSVKTVNDVTVNGKSVVSGKTADITMKGETIPVADTYTTTSYPSPFDEGAEHIAPTDKVNVALKKVETNISKLVTEVIDNEDVASEAIAKLAESAGTVDGEKNIKYKQETNAHYINNAVSVHDATVKLDNSIYSLETEVIDNENVTSEAINKLAESAGTLGEDNSIKYKQETNAHYIKNAVSVHDATVKLDDNVYSLGTNVASLGKDVTTIGGNVTNIQNSVTSIQTNVTNIQTSVTTIEGNIHSLQVTDGQLNERIIALENIIKGMDSTEWVDLGLPSGTFWAKCNLGAETETAYGDYYMWGSTTPDSNHVCNWANAPFNNGSDTYNEEYFNSVKDKVCQNDILAKGYDAAYKSTNGAARMPTSKEYYELEANTSNVWVNNFNSTGVNGWKFTSKTDTSKYIFFPASGYRSESEIRVRGKYGYYCISTINSLMPENYYGFNFNSTLVQNDDCYRYYGCCVRPVRNLPL